MLAEGAEDSASLRQIGWCWLDSDIESSDLCWAGWETECLGHDRVCCCCCRRYDISGTYRPVTESVFLDNPRRDVVNCGFSGIRGGEKWAAFGEKVRRNPTFPRLELSLTVLTEVKVCPLLTSYADQHRETTVPLPHFYLTSGPSIISVSVSRVFSFSIWQSLSLPFHP